jgi:hypothetical protein
MRPYKQDMHSHFNSLHLETGEIYSRARGPQGLHHQLS